MRILAVDIGGGTQDILLFDSSRAVENCIKMVMPSPTIALAEKIASATSHRRPLLFTGVNMGSGGTRRLVKKHIESGLTAYSTPEAACTFYDDMTEIEKLGIILVSPDEAAKLKEVERVEMKDLHLNAIRGALNSFGVDPTFDAIAVAVLDHGAAPPGVSDRIFRFQHLQRVVEKNNNLEAFAYLPGDVPPYLTRMKSVAQTLDLDIPLLLLDTGAAAALGALQDKEAGRHRDLIVINLGNFHTLAFRLHQRKIMGLFEHHTSRMTSEKIDGLLEKFISCQLANEAVFNDGGHGCVPVKDADSAMPLVIATGPRRGLIITSKYKPYMAAPYGDMMLTGCYGLIRGVASRMGNWREEILQALGD